MNFQDKEWFKKYISDDYVKKVVSGNKDIIELSKQHIEYEGLSLLVAIYKGRLDQ